MQKTRAVRTPDANSDARARIIDAARELFATLGFEGASTRRIAENAGVAQSLLLYHFGSKEILWKAVMDDIFEWANGMIHEFEASEQPDTVEERIMVGVRAFIQMCQERPDFHRLMTLEGRSESERLIWLAETHLKPMFKQNTDLLRKGQIAGSIRPGDPTLLHYSMIGIAGTAYAFAPEIKLLTGKSRPPDPKAIEEQIRALLFK